MISEDEESQKMKAAVFSNIALCHLKMGNLSEVRRAVSSSIWKYWNIQYILCLLYTPCTFLYYILCFIQCGTVLEIEPNNVKALYRRGLSYVKSDDPALALEDFEKVTVFSVATLHFYIV